MTTQDKIVDRSSIPDLANQWREAGHTIVFSNGCFDILHLGHIDYLEKTAEKGDKLVVGLNTDASVKILKGENRPINNEQSRARMLAALAFVDAVVLFDEETPLSLIEEVMPDVLVKGDDYLTENIVGADFVLARGGKVETVSLVEGYSTTGLIDRIKKA